MKRDDFLNNTQVEAFVNWLACNSQSISADFSIKHSAKVPSGLYGLFVGLENINEAYCWNAQWEIGDELCSSSDWKTTRDSLSRLASHLRQAISSGDSNRLMEVVQCVFKWGGIRNIHEGAGAFVKGKATNLVEYFQSTSQSLVLEHAELDNETLHLSNDDSPQLMNAMLTKVYALLSMDGLPIYDSRVAGAIASLVEIWHESIQANGGGNGKKIAPHLKFPSTERSSRRSIPGCLGGVREFIGRNNCGKGKPTADWVSAKIRLGWILYSVLQKNKELFKNESTIEKKMHAFEAALFMIGYDTSSLCGYAHKLRGSNNNFHTISNPPMHP